MNKKNHNNTVYVIINVLQLYYLYKNLQKITCFVDSISFSVFIGCNFMMIPSKDLYFFQYKLLTTRPRIICSCTSV